MAATMVMMLFLGVASAAYQGGGDQTYHTEDEHLSHGGPGGNGTMSASPTGIIVLMAVFCAVVVTLAAWRVYSNEGKPEEKPEEKAQPELEMTVGADLEEGVEREEESKRSQKRFSGSTAASDTPLVDQQ
jgi:hypothetical protein